ncbi:hypothetical protein EDB81DRAFT_901788 [Dactylonectria macrodidyma]|uniref:F-box domain-containing protein n=1 Tax=Dactylonectria macrodidyma TaxID=307937 RepID=A0A9P9IXZ9_9HYPO|nr:hypothetical protein EDB81DRAFT_901788 [Dactylonectria macrodidyma]
MSKDGPRTTLGVENPQHRTTTSVSRPRETNAPSLTTLPLEILSSVARSLCSLEEELSDQGVPDEVEADRRSLSSLSKTCKLFRRIAQPLVFSILSTESNRFVGLVRALVGRPDLAANVKAMYINGWGICYSNRSGREPWQITPEDALILNTALDQYTVLGDNQNPLRISAIGALADPNSVDDRELVGALAALAILQCHNVEELVIRTEHWDMPSVLQPVALNSLVSLEVSEADSDLGVTIGSGVAWMLAAAPALRRVGGQAVTNVVPELFHDNLRVLDLRISGLCRNSFDAIAKGFPKLEKLVYSNGSSDLTWRQEVSPQYAMRAMRQRRDTLKHLSLSWERADPSSWTQDGLLQSVACMTALEEISISSAGLSINKNVADLDGSFFIKFLPPNIQEITIRETNAPWNIAPLAQIAPSHLLSLKRVQIVLSWRSTTPEREAGLKALFGTRGIELKFVRFGKYPFM